MSGFVISVNIIVMCNDLICAHWHSRWLGGVFQGWCLSNLIINYVAVCKQRFTKNDTQLYWFKTREDKGDREGIPHTHSIPWVIRLELFLESMWSYLARCVDVSWRFRMTKRRAKNVGWKADENIKKSRAFLIIEAKWVGAHLGKGNQFNSKLS